MVSQVDDITGWCGHSQQVSSLCLQKSTTLCIGNVSWAKYLLLIRGKGRGKHTHQKKDGQRYKENGTL